MPEPGRPGSRQAAIPASWLPPATAGGAPRPGDESQAPQPLPRVRRDGRAGPADRPDPRPGQRPVPVDSPVVRARPGPPGDAPLRRARHRDDPAALRRGCRFAGTPGRLAIPCAGWPRFPFTGPRRWGAGANRAARPRACDLADRAAGSGARHVMPGQMPALRGHGLPNTTSRIIRSMVPRAYLRKPGYPQIPDPRLWIIIVDIEPGNLRKILLHTAGESRFPTS